MSIGPIQVIVFGFEHGVEFRGEVLAELASLRGRGLVRLMDLLVATKEPDSSITVLRADDLSEQESAEFGRVLGQLLGVSGLTGRDVAVAAIERTMSAASASLGLDYKSLGQVVENLPAGKAFGVLMFEHTWAIPLGAAIQRAGGVPLAQGFLTPETLVMVGQELNAIADAINALEVSETVKSATILDTLARLNEAEATRTAIAADVVRTLAVAGVIEEAAVDEAIEILRVAGLLEPSYLDAAVVEEARAAAEIGEYFAEE